MFLSCVCKYTLVDGEDLARILVYAVVIRHHDGQQLVTLLGLGGVHRHLHQMPLVVLHGFQYQQAIQIERHDDELHQQRLEGHILIELGVQTHLAVGLFFVCGGLRHHTLIVEDDGESLLELPEEVVGAGVAGQRISLVLETEIDLVEEASTQPQLQHLMLDLLHEEDLTR